MKGTGQVGFATSKRIGCHARRNRQRRRAIAAWSHVHTLTTEWDCILVLAPNAHSATFEQLKIESLQLVQRMKERWGNG